MSSKTPSDYFTLTDDDIIVSDHAKRLIEQERILIEQERPMEKLEEIFNVDAPICGFTTRVNGAGQFSIFKSDSDFEEGVCIILSARILSPFMGESAKAKPKISMRLSIQIKDVRFYFARLAAIKTPDGTTSCAVCAIRSNNANEYYFEDNYGKVFTGGDLDIPITTDDLIVATRLSKSDLISAVSLASKLFHTNIETFETLNHLLKSIQKLEFMQ